MAADVQSGLVAQLVIVPYLAGLAAGLARPRTPLFFALFIFGAAVIIDFVWLDRPRPVDTSNARLLGTGLLWISLGAAFGSALRKFVGRFGFRGLVYTLGVVFVGIGLGELVAQQAIPFLRDELTTDDRRAARGYIGLVFSGAALTYLVRPTFVPTLKKALSLFTIVGAVEFGLNQVWGGFLYSVAWFLPGADPPPDFRIWLPILIGVWAVVYVDDVRLHARDIKVDALAGLQAAELREEGARESNDAFAVAPFQWSVPNGWAIVNAGRHDAPYALALTPDVPATRWSERLPVRLRRPARLFVYVYRYAGDEVDFGLLKRSARINLLGRDATVLDEDCGRRHGVASYECVFTDGGVYCFVVLFVVGGNELAIEWQSADPERFRALRPTVDKFIDDLRFAP